MGLAKILIVEDEIIIAREMQSVLKKKGYEIVDIVATKEQVFEAIATDKPDLILMDIELYGENTGIIIAKNVRNHFKIPILFITHLTDEHVFGNAKEAFPVNYITKPFPDSALLHAVELAVQNSQNQFVTTKSFIEHIDEDFVFLKTTKSDEIVKIFRNDILYIEADSVYSMIYLKSKEQTTISSMKITLSTNHLVEQLAYPPILKVHKSFYINVDNMEKMTRSKAWVAGIEIPISPRHTYKLQRVLKSKTIGLKK